MKFLNRLRRDRTEVEDVENHLEKTSLRLLGHVERMDKINLIKRVREERFPGRMKRRMIKKVLG